MEDNGCKRWKREWKKGKMVRLIQSKDGVFRGVTLFRKGDTIERPSETKQRKLLLSLRRGGDSKLTLEARDQDELQLKGLTRELQNT